MTNSLSDFSADPLHRVYQQALDLHQEELELARAIPPLAQKKRETDAFISLQSQQSMGGRSLFAPIAGPRLSAIGRAHEYELLLSEKKARLELLREQRQQTVLELLTIAEAEWIPGDRTSSESHRFNERTRLARLALQFGSEALAAEQLELAADIAPDAASALFLKLRAHALSTAPWDGPDILSTIAALRDRGDERWRLLLPTYALSIHRHQQREQTDPKRMDVTEAHFLSLLHNRLDANNVFVPPLSSTETLMWLDVLTQIVRRKASSIPETPRDERDAITDAIRSITADAYHLASPFFQYSDNAAAPFRTELGAATVPIDVTEQLFARDDVSGATDVREGLVAFLAEAHVFADIVSEHPARAIEQFDEIKSRFPDTKAIETFERGICTQFDRLCTDGKLITRQDKAFEAMLTTSFGHIDDLDATSELGLTAGGGAAGLLACYGLGLSGGFVGEGIAIPTCSLLFTGGMLTAWGGVRGYNIYAAREEIAESSLSGLSLIDPSAAALRAQSLPMDAGLMAMLGLIGGGFSGSVKSAGQAVYTGTIQRGLAKGLDAYARFINRPSVLVGSGVLAVADVGLVDADYDFAWEQDYAFDGFSHWWGFIPATMVLGNAAAQKIPFIALDAKGSAVATMVTTGMQFFIQSDGGSDPDYFDYNRALSRYAYSMVGTAVGKKSLGYVASNPKNVLRWVGTNGSSNPVLTLRGKFLFGTSNILAMGAINYVTADAQGVDADNSTIARSIDKVITEFAISPLQARLGFDGPLGLLTRKTLGSLVEGAINTLCNMYEDQSLYQKPLRIYLDTDRAEHDQLINDPDMRQKLLSMMRRGTMVRGASHPLSRRFSEVTTENLFRIYANLPSTEKTQYHQLLRLYVEDCAQGQLTKDEERTLQLMIAAVLSDIGLTVQDHRNMRIDLINPDLAATVTIPYRDAPSTSIPLTVDHKRFSTMLNNGDYDNLIPAVRITVPSAEEKQ